MFFSGLQLHQIDDVDDADPQVGYERAQEVDGCESLERWNITATCHDDVGLRPLIVARPFPDADSGRAMFDGSIHVEPLRGGLLPRNDDVDVVTAPQTVVGDAQQTVRVGWQINPDDLGLLVDDVIDETGILMAEAVVVLAPDMAREQ